MYTIEELEQHNDLQLHRELLDVISIIIGIWRSIPLNEFPTEKQEKDISMLEEYSMTIAKILIKRGKLPENWGQK